MSAPRRSVCALCGSPVPSESGPCPRCSYDELDYDWAQVLARANAISERARRRLGLLGPERTTPGPGTPVVALLLLACLTLAGCDTTSAADWARYASCVEVLTASETAADSLVALQDLPPGERFNAHARYLQRDCDWYVTRFAPDSAPPPVPVERPDTSR